MTPDTALAIIDEVTSKYLGTREDHKQIALAVETLRGLITVEGDDGDETSGLCKDQPAS